MRFDQQVVWVTGASSGIGAALAAAFAGEGARVVLSARRQEALREVAVGLGIPEERLAIVPLDLARPESLAAAAEAVLARFGQVDVLVNNAGVSQRARALDTDWRVDEQIMRVNWLGPVALTKAVLPSMVARGSGRVVVISSVAGKLGSPLRSGYSGSKFALQGFFDALRAELADTGVSVTLVFPGFVQTDISRNALTGDGTPQGTMDVATAAGLAASVAAARIVDAVAAGRREVIVAGPRERLGVILQRLAPGLLARMLRTAKVT